MRVRGFDASRTDRDLLSRQYDIALTSPLDAAIGRADVVSVHVPSMDSTRHLVDAAFLGHMKPSAYLINTSRGAVVDEGALFDAIASGWIAGAALDVFATEPYRPHDSGKDLRQLSNVVLTPHVASNTQQANMRMAERVVANLSHAVAGNLSQMDLVSTPLN